MGLLQLHGVTDVYHCTPLHYLVFICRSGMLRSKPALMARGFEATHFRSMSRNQDSDRGFGKYVHLTLHPFPPILSAKLEAGFPHVRLGINAVALDKTPHSLCRYNIAMTRYLRRDKKRGFEASATNGRYYGDQQIPIARTDNDRAAMLKKHLGNTMIEVLVEHEIAVPDDTVITCYSEADAVIARQIVEILKCPWAIKIEQSETSYERNAIYVRRVKDFIRRALAEPSWNGDGLEFDRV